LRIPGLLDRTVVALECEITYDQSLGPENYVSEIVSAVRGRLTLSNSLDSFSRMSRTSWPTFVSSFGEAMLRCTHPLLFAGSLDMVEDVL
jgi:hypothetical protein